MKDANTAPVTLTWEELYELVWTTPMRRLARRFGLSEVGLAKICKKHQIPRTPRGHWAHREHRARERPAIVCHVSRRDRWQPRPRGG